MLKKWDSIVDGQLQSLHRRALLRTGLSFALAPIVSVAHPFSNVDESHSDSPGRSIELFWSLSLQRAARSVVRIIWNGGNSGATGVLVGDDWLLTAQHNFLGTAGIGAHVFVLDFDATIAPASREYLVRDPLFECLSGGSLALDYALVKLKRRDEYEPAVAARRRMRFPLRPRITPESRSSCVSAYVVGHPASGDECSSDFRNWAFKTAKFANVYASNKSELVVTGQSCEGTSGSPIVDQDGYLLGIVCGFVSAQNPDARPRALRIDKIIEDALPKFRNFGYAIPRGLSGPIVGAKGDGRVCRDDSEEHTFDKPEVRKTEADNEEEHAPDVAATSNASLISHVGYIWFDKIDFGTGAGTCFHLGDNWILTAKHVLHNRALVADARITFDFLRKPCTGMRQECDAKQLSDTVGARSYLRLYPDTYFCSDDGIDSATGKERRLDYALVKLQRSKGDEALMPREELGLDASPRFPKVGDSLHIPQHRQSVAKYWVQLVMGGNRIVGADTNRLYYDAAVDKGASGAPIFDSKLRLIGIHTNSRDAACSRKSEQSTADNCAPRAYWERAHTPPTEKNAYGTRITAIIQDLVLRHKVDMAQIPALANAWESDVVLHGFGSY